MIPLCMHLSPLDRIERTQIMHMHKQSITHTHFVLVKGNIIDNTPH